MQINHNKKAESLAAIIISVFILSVALLGIMNIVTFSKDTAIDYENEMFKHIIQSNSETLVKKFDYLNLANDEKFYIYKDEVNKQFLVLTGASNSGSQYIDVLGNRIDDLQEGLGKTYKREFTHKSDILKHRIDPFEVPNTIFHFDAQNIDGNQNTTLSDGDPISTWLDLENNNDATTTGVGNSPVLDITAINGKPGVSFDGNNDLLSISKNALINNDDICSTDLAYNQKSFTMVIKTSDDVTSKQAIYEQGGVATGYNFMIYNGDLYAGIHNRTRNDTRYSCYFNESLGPRPQDRDNWHKVKSVSLGEALPNTVYYVTVVQDSNNFLPDGSPDDSVNKLQIYLNGELVLETNHVDPQPEHDIGGLGGIYQNNVEPWASSSARSDGSHHATISCSECYNFKGIIGEFVSWNHALSEAEVRGIHNYLLAKWLHGKQTVNYSIINTNISKHNSN